MKFIFIDRLLKRLWIASTFRGKIELATTCGWNRLAEAVDISNVANDAFISGVVRLKWTIFFRSRRMETLNVSRNRFIDIVSLLKPILKAVFYPGATSTWTFGRGVRPDTAPVPVPYSRPDPRLTHAPHPMHAPRSSLFKSSNRPDRPSRTCTQRTQNGGPCPIPPDASCLTHPSDLPWHPIPAALVSIASIFVTPGREVQQLDYQRLKLSSHLHPDILLQHLDETNATFA
jgi:hypothetical protein